MTEGLLGGVLGNEDEKPETEAPGTLAGADAFAAAVAARLSASDPEVARDTSVFLKKQAQLLETQNEHLKDEHALRLEHLAHQRQLLRGQRISQAIRISFQILIALLVLAVALGIAAMLHRAFTSHEVVIDTFDAPAGLAARGVTGSVVAGDVLDALTGLQNDTTGTAATFERNLSNAWSSQLRVEVPDTGISLGDLSALLSAHFGHDLHIGGALVETDSGQLVLTIRGDNLAPKTFTGSAGMLQQLAAEAAQYVYAQSEPALWAFYLFHQGRCPEAIAFVRSAYEDADPQFRPYLLNAEANCVRETGGRMSVREALALYHAAQALEPDYWVTYLNEQLTLSTLGDEEGAWRAAQALRRAAGGQPGAAPRIYFIDWEMLTRDFQTAHQTLADASNAGERAEPLPRDQIFLLLALVDVDLHDPDAAELALQNAPQSTPRENHNAAFIRARAAEERGDHATAAQEMEAAFAGDANPFEQFGAAMLAGAERDCVRASIEEVVGHPEKADAILADPAVARYADCQRFRGDILDHRGDWPGAQQAYTQAVALAPDLPAGYYSWGVALANHGDLAGGLAKFQAANQRGPHWADPLKAWGDVLAKQGHWGAALAKYDEALKYAPRWAALKQARDAAAKKSP